MRGRSPYTDASDLKLACEVASSPAGRPPALQVLLISCGAEDGARTGPRKQGSIRKKARCSDVADELHTHCHTPWESAWGAGWMVGPRVNCRWRLTSTFPRSSSARGA